MEIKCWLTISYIVGNEEIDLRWKSFLFWQNLWNNGQFAADIDEKLANQEEVLRGGISRTYRFLSNKWKSCHGAINGKPRKLRTALEKSFHWNCKQLRVEARNSMSNCEICFPLLKLYIKFWKYFYSMAIGSIGRDYCKKKGVWILSQNFSVRLPQRR